MTGRTALGILLCLGLALPASAHRLDEYLQATLISISAQGIDIEIQLTPGVAVLPLVLDAIDRDHDGRISPEEQRAYGDRVRRNVELQVDGATAPLTVVDATFPGIESIKEGLGTIRLRLRTSRTGRSLRFENRHLPKISAYLVNCLAAPALHVGPQHRDDLQKSIAFEYSLDNAAPAAPERWPVWAGAIAACLLAGRALYQIRKSPQQGRVS
jgi:hypothetical protein